MDWAKVVNALRDNAAAVRDSAEAAFQNDPMTRLEMRHRAAIGFMLADALSAGLDPEARANLSR